MAKTKHSRADRGPGGAAAAAAELGRRSVESLPEGELARKLERDRPLRVKLGIDPTAPDIHLGHVVVLAKLRDFQDAGHTVVLIVGDYTARVGDPSGRSAQRPVLSDDEIEVNAATFTNQAFKVLDRDRCEVRFNSEWLSMPSAELFAIARRFTVARLLERDDFAKRMAAEQPVSLLELLYPVLQGYDSVAVEADVELGGTDQKFNLLFGRDVQSSFGAAPQVVMTMPILPGTDGVNRMSKSAGNYIGVAEEPAEMFGKAMSVPDEVMGDYYELVLRSELDPDEHPGEAKRRLGRMLVERFHDAGAAAEAEQRFDRIHVAGELPDEVDEADLPAGAELHLPALLAEHFGLSRSEVRRMIAQGGVRIDGEPVAPDLLDVPRERVEGAVVQLGKRRFKRFLPTSGQARRPRP